MCSSVGGIGVTQLGARVPGNGPRDLVDIALFGYQDAPDGVPAPPEAAARPTPTASSRTMASSRGDTLRLGPARSPVKVVGFVDDVSYSGAGSLWASPDTWRDVQNANRPGSSVAPGVFQALVVAQPTATRPPSHARSTAPPEARRPRSRARKPPTRSAG